MKPHNSPRIPIAFALAVVLTSSLIVACGGDEEADYSGDAPSGVATNGAPQTVEMTASDFSFAPADLTAKAGDSLELVLTNAGNAPHTFTIDEFGVDAEVAAGEETTISVTPSDSGEFTYYCRFHRQQGMQGSITVSGAGGAGDSNPTESPADDGYYGY
jgi:plastocyanin